MLWDVGDVSELVNVNFMDVLKISDRAALFTAVTAVRSAPPAVRQRRYTHSFCLLLVFRPMQQWELLVVVNLYL